MRVVAIDPAPAKESTMYSAEGGFRSVPASEMRGVLKDLASPVLLCWDAPLTGPRHVEEAGLGFRDFSQRCLDSFFTRTKPFPSKTKPPSSQKVKDFKAPKGISVQPYSGCPHWTISRSVLGLPRLGPYDQCDALPFRLLPNETFGGDGKAVSKENDRFVVEIHPAVAAWLWCKDLPPTDGFPPKTDWTYKGGKKEERAAKTRLWEQMWEHISLKIRDTLPKPKNDDQFDAAVGYVLGSKWLNGDRDVLLLGNRGRGSMLLPRVDGLEEKWTEFQSAWPGKAKAQA